MKETQYRNTCYRCFRPLDNCYCQHIQPFETKIHFVILMHPKEARKQKTGTGRLTHLTLTNSEIIVDIDCTYNKRINQIINDPNRYSAVLYPSKRAKEITQNQIPHELSINKNITIFIIDATWWCAKKIWNSSSNLQSLPHIAFDNQEPSRFAIKKQPNDYCLSTIEATYYLLKLCNKHQIEQTANQEQTMMDILSRLVQFQISHKNLNAPKDELSGTYIPGE